MLFLRISIVVSFIFCSCNPDKSFDKLVTVPEVADIRKGFLDPPDSTRPYVYWYWVSDNISKDGITRDLEAMAKVGIGEAFIGSIGVETVPYGDVKVLSDEWWELTRFAIKEGQRLGVDIGLFNSPGWSQSGGPWVKAEQAMRFMVTRDWVVEGGKDYAIQLRNGDSAVQDIAVMAYPMSDEENTTRFSFPDVQIQPYLDSAYTLADHNMERGLVFAGNSIDSGLIIDFTFKENINARSLLLLPEEFPFSATVEVQAFSEKRFHSVRKIGMDRSNTMITVGPMVYGPVAIALPDVVASKFRLILSDIKVPDNKNRKFGFKEIVFSSAPRLERFVEKQLGKMLQYPNLVWDEYLWPEQIKAGTEDLMVNSKKVLNITRYLGEDGVLRWKPPVGNWIITRIGVTPTGAVNSPASPEATGYEVDKMNKRHLKSHFDAYIGKILRDMPAAERKSLKHVVMDSYEVGPQNWTEGFEQDFKERYGYDPMVWMPVLTGRIVNSADESDRFLWDLRRLIADRIAFDYVGGLRNLSEEHGLRVWLENYGHWGFPSEFLVYGGQTNDIAGEFWVEGTLGNVECRAASSAAHIYGINRVFAESYTAGGKMYERYPGYLKKRGDWSFTEGINHVLLHLYIHQPYDKEPGMNAWFGTEFNRKNTWFEQAESWIDYQRRCTFLLQQGKPVNDLCYFIGEDAPKLAGSRIPEIPSGYSYDYINADVILNKIKVEAGKLVLPDGMSYRMMVLPPLKTITPELLNKIKELVQAGAILYGPKPERSPSRKNFPFADEKVKLLADELWGKGVLTPGQKKFGKGKVCMGISLEEALKAIDVQKDYEVPDGKPLLLTHRKTADLDIYFISNQSDEKVDASVKFRVNGKAPELWDATNGTIRKLPAFTSFQDITEVPLQFEPAQSYFIVFADQGSSVSGKQNFPKPSIIEKIADPWTVSFDSARRGPVGDISFPVLQDWTLHTNDSIKYYSGTAFYKNRFNGMNITPGERLYLDLGVVKNMARIKINGQSVGSLWTAPWQVDITDFISDKSNTVEIEVVNLWVNRLIGDSRMPPDQRPTWLANNFFSPADSLHPSGLLGPVTIKRIKE